MATYPERRAALIEAIKKPVNFASRDSYAGVDKLKGMEALIAALKKEALELVSNSEGSFGTDISSLLDNLQTLFSGFDSEPTGVKQKLVAEAAGLVGRLLNTPVVAPLSKPGAACVIQPFFSGPVTEKIKELKRGVQFVKGVGPRLAAVLNKKGIYTVEDLLYFIPVRYEDRSRRRKIRELEKGETVSVVATIMATGESRYGRRRVFEIVVTDSTGLLKLKWFNFKTRYMSRFVKDKKYLIYGTVSAWGRQVEMIHPDLKLYDEDGTEGRSVNETADESTGLLPVYSQLERMHQLSIRKVVLGALKTYSSNIVSAVPEAVAKRHGLLDLKSAFELVHLPGAKGEAAVKSAKRSLAFDELFLLEIGLALKRQGVKRSAGIELSCGLPRVVELESALRKKLPFKLTASQESVLKEIKADMSAPHPMNRLLQGDVGSGKTVVSLIAALVAVGAGYQAAIMAPTEILAEQHSLVIKEYTDSLGLKTALLTSGIPKKKKDSLLASINEGEVDIVVGTHALIQKGVEFDSLALVVIDEQHRFGVMQRAELKKKGIKQANGTLLPPDMLIMTATPIPRTLTMTLFSDLEVSIIDELPPGRFPVTTKILREKDRERAYDIIRENLKKGSQAYVVCPLVEESEELQLADVMRTKERLDVLFGGFNVGLIHGRLKSAEKEAVMASFKAGRIDLLVSTTVIEVGVDVPNATVMLIEHAERFGLAQLHQLRGRVGRGSGKSICLLLAQWTNSEDTYRRLKVLEATEDGFKIAEEDLAIRGPGDFIGTRQSGLPEFRFSASLGDLGLLKSAREEAVAHLETDPFLLSAQSATIKEVLKARWKERLELAEIG